MLYNNNSNKNTEKYEKWANSLTHSIYLCTHTHKTISNANNSISSLTHAIKYGSLDFDKHKVSPASKEVVLNY